MVSTWVKEKSESFSPPLWDVWELDLVSFIEQYLFSKEMVPKNRQSPGKMYSWPGQPFSDLTTFVAICLSLEGFEADTLHGQSQKVKKNPQEMRRKGALQQKNAKGKFIVGRLQAKKREARVAEKEI